MGTFKYSEDPRGNAAFATGSTGKKDLQTKEYNIF